MRALAYLVSLPALVLPVAMIGCEELSWYEYDCNEYANCEPAHPCPGQCVPLAPLDFNGPALLWMGPEPEAPACPDRAPTVVYEGYGALDDSNACPPCECTEPACVLPSGLMASSEACSKPGEGIQTPFEAPSGWGGACASPTTVPSNLLGSVSIEPVTARPCEPVPPEVPHGGAPLSPWGTFARACLGEPILDVCGDPGMTCLPTAAPPPPGFRQCIVYLREGDPQCPEDYPEEHTFYGALEDTRGCTACECIETTPSSCVALVSTFQDAACSEPLIAATVGTSGPLCADVMPGIQLAGMEATWTTNEPGSCIPSGGVPTGEAKPRDPRTFCCQPAP